jgi:hypothetical protein
MYTCFFFWKHKDVLPPPPGTVSAVAVLRRRFEGACRGASSTHSWIVELFGNRNKSLAPGFDMPLLAAMLLSSLTSSWRVRIGICVSLVIVMLDIGQRFQVDDDVRRGSGLRNHGGNNLIGGFVARVTLDSNLVSLGPRDYWLGRRA